MANGTQERWRELCELAILESDPQRLNELFREIDQLLAEGDDQPAPVGVQNEPAASVAEADPVAPPSVEAD